MAVVLVVMAAIMLLAVGVLTVVGIERKTARAYIDSKRAEWIARAGMEDVRAMLGEQTANDDFLVLSQLGEGDAPDDEPLVGIHKGRIADETFHTTHSAVRLLHGNLGDHGVTVLLDDIGDLLAKLGNACR